VLAASAGSLRARLGPRLLRAINIVSGLTILGFAAWQFAVLLR
jgi:threonine/homoserine/homoserine lactone efflux protein